MSCPYCHRERAPESSPAPGALPAIAAASPDPPTASTDPPAARPNPPTARPAAPPPAKPLRAARKTGWLLPGILLVLMPKCPICLAAYIALVTGITIPITAATRLRTSLIVGCTGALIWLAVRWSLYLYRRFAH